MKTKIGIADNAKDYIDRVKVELHEEMNWRAFSTTKIEAYLIDKRSKEKEGMGLLEGICSLKE